MKNSETMKILIYFMVAAVGAIQHLKANGNTTSSTPKIQIQYCDMVKAPLNGNMLFKLNGKRIRETSTKNILGLSPGTKAIFRCNKGFRLQGKRRIKCLHDLNWTSEIPRCVMPKIQKQYCDMIKAPLNGSTLFKLNGKRMRETSTKNIRGLSPGTKAIFSCNKGFRLQGTKRIKCLHNLNWSGEKPRCITYKCRTIKSVRNGRIEITGGDEQFGIQTTVTIFCNNGYIINGPDAMVCTHNGWRPSRPSRCYRIKCGDPYHPDNGRRLGGRFFVNDTLMFFCNPGFKLYGSSVRKCQSDGRWSGRAVICDYENKRYDCRAVAVPTNGRKIGDTYNNGDTVHFQCNRGYLLIGNEKITCNNSIWNKKEPICEDNKMIAFPNANEEFDKMQENLIKPLTEATCSSYGKNCTNSARGRSLFTHNENGLDLILAIDTSSSIGIKNFPHAIEFACSLIKKLGVSKSDATGTRIAAITFATEAYKVYNLGDERVDTTNKAILETKRIKYHGGGTNYASMFKKVKEVVVPFFRTYSKRALVIISDGMPNMGGVPARQSQNFRVIDKGIIYAIGIGSNFGKNGRRFLIVTTGDSKRVFEFKKYKNLEDLVIKVADPDAKHECGLSASGFIAGRGRMVGGEKSRIKYWPWQVAIYHQGIFKCGGSIIDKEFVLTAAHCFSKIYFEHEWHVILGIDHIKPNNTLTGGEWYKNNRLSVRNITVHQGFNRITFIGDVAIIQLMKPLSWTTTIKPICLPGKDDFILPDDTGYVAGWGKRHENAQKVSEFLIHQKFRIRNNSTCKSGSRWEYHQHATFCAGEGQGKTDTCSGDSGGAFATQIGDRERWYAVGIVSHGGISKDVCASKDSYGYFTRLSTYLGWIRNVVGIH